MEDAGCDHDLMSALMRKLTGTRRLSPVPKQQNSALGVWFKKMDNRKYYEVRSIRPVRAALHRRLLRPTKPQRLEARELKRWPLLRTGCGVNRPSPKFLWGLNGDVWRNLA
jgi:hypothetical protein